MDADAFRPALDNIIERITRLENELKELRQLLPVQKSCLERPPDCPSTIPSMAAAPEVGVARSYDWEVTCLGRFQLRCKGRLLTPCKSRRGQSILKYLLASPKYAVSSELLIECFWPQGDSVAGAHNLQMAIYALRHSLCGCGPDGNDETVLFCDNRYFLNPALFIKQDVDDFRSAYEYGRQAISSGDPPGALHAFEEARVCYTGDYLVDPYEEWATAYRVALQDMCLAMLSQLGLLYKQARNWESAISCYRDILTIDPYREDIYCLLMRCYVARGRLADVKRVYDACQEYLLRDLHLAPAHETTKLYQQLLR